MLNAAANFFPIRCSIDLSGQANIEIAPFDGGIDFEV